MGKDGCVLQGGQEAAPAGPRSYDLRLAVYPLVCYIYISADKAFSSDKKTVNNKDLYYY